MAVCRDPPAPEELILLNALQSKSEQGELKRKCQFQPFQMALGYFVHQLFQPREVLHINSFHPQTPSGSALCCQHLGKPPDLRDLGDVSYAVFIGLPALLYCSGNPLVSCRY